ncbi:hypothetical protein [Brevibacillus sp. DP1.3A]|uniref:hypothetical protein n=1 Tax=Brevibacillus sp. DP1.3A TaxID=2738867 RepID=UPI00156A8ABC|nr:hypothetical protein [Brevibacillus sp. DP1.3A]UED78073.1 hypothetical protein HP399_030580 [Brevibacillus sp. DP1.3A]
MQIRVGQGQPIPVRKVRSDKKVRVNSSLSKDTHDKLVMLATSCGMTKTTLAEIMINTCVNSQDYVKYIQDKHNKNPQYRVSPVIVDNKKVQYMFLD